MTGDDHADAGGTAARFDPTTRRARPAATSAPVGVHPRHLVRLPEHDPDQRSGRRPTPRRLRGRAARQHGLRGLHAGVARGRLRPISSSDFGRQVPEPPGADHEPDALHRLERLGRAAAGGARPRHPARHELLLLAAGLGRRTCPGMFTGSGMPMRFADTDGTLIDVYQATTQMTDESGQTYPVHGQHAARPRARRAGLLRRVHRQHAHRRRERTRARTRSSPRRRRAACPVVSAQQMLTWLDGRNASSFDPIAYSSGDPQLPRHGRRGRDRPARHGAGDVRRHARSAMTRDGAPLTFTRETIKGVEYATFPASIGAYTASYARRHGRPRDQRAGRDGRDRRHGDRDLDDGRGGGLARGLRHVAGRAHASRRPTPPTVTAHSVRLTGLRPGTTYYYRVRSADDARQRDGRPGGGERARHVPRAAVRDRHAVRRRRSTRARCAAARAVGAGHRRQRLLPGQLDDQRHPHELVLRLVHRRAHGDQLADGDLPRAQLGLLYAGDPDLALDGRHLAAAELRRPGEHGDDPRAVHAGRARRAATSAPPARCACACAARRRRTSSPPASRCRSRTWCRRRGPQPGERGHRQHERQVAVALAEARPDGRVGEGGAVGERERADGEHAGELDGGARRPAARAGPSAARRRRPRRRRPPPRSARRRAARRRSGSRAGRPSARRRRARTARTPRGAAAAPRPSSPGAREPHADHAERAGGEREHGGVPAARRRPA